MYMSWSSPAKRAASSPPAPARISMMTSLSSFGSQSMSSVLMRSERSSIRSSASLAGAKNSRSSAFSAWD